MADENTSATDETESTESTGTVDVALLEGVKNPDAVSNAIRAEREAARAAGRERDELAAKVREYEDAKKSDQEKLDERAQEADRRATDAETRLLRYEVAAAKNVPLNQAHRLAGTTKEELEADADEFLKSLGEQATTSFDGGARESHEPQDMNALIRRSAGRT